MVGGPTLTETEQTRIADAVKAAEQQTSAEIRLVLAHASGLYSEFELIYPGPFALIVGGAIAWLQPTIDAGRLFMIEAALFLFSFLALQWPALRRRLVPASVKRKAAWRHARLNYANIGLTRLHDRGAVMIFCSAAEHYVEILVDDSIAEKLPQSTWAPIVERFKARFAAGAVVDAFVEAADACAQALAPHFPHRPGETNMLSDALEEV